MGRPRPVVVVLVVSMFAEAVGDVRPLALRGVVAALVSAGGAMGGGAAVSSGVSVTLMVGRPRCCFWVWVRVREVFALFWALRACFPAGADHRPLALSGFGGRSWWRVMSLVGFLRVLLQALGVVVVEDAALPSLVGGADSG